MRRAIFVPHELPIQEAQTVFDVICRPKIQAKKPLTQNSQIEEKKNKKSKKSKKKRKDFIKIDPVTWSIKTT